MHGTTWIIAADASRARIFETRDDEHFQEVNDMVNPQGRMDGRELESDARTRKVQHGRMMGSSTTEPKIDQSRHMTELFAKGVSDYLEHARTSHRFDHLELIAPPEFLGIMREKLDEQTRRIVTEEAPKDVAWFSDHDLSEYLRARHH